MNQKAVVQLVGIGAGEIGSPRTNEGEEGEVTGRSGFKRLLLGEMGRLSVAFDEDELAYLAITSKVENPIRDRLAYGLHRALWPRAVVAREWFRTDLAILSPTTPPRALALVEAKATMTFDLAYGMDDAHWVARAVRRDLEKSARLAIDGTEIFALVIVVHPDSPLPPSLGANIVKYLPGVARAFRTFQTAAKIRALAARSLRANFSSLGPLSRGSMSGGSAFGVGVSLDWWLLGPVRPGEIPRNSAIAMQQRV
jgi:hypothetical protein